MRYYYTHVRLNKQKSDNNKYWLVCGANGALSIVGRTVIWYDQSGFVCLERGDKLFTFV